MFLYLYETFLPIYIPTPLPQILHTSTNILEKLMVDGKEILPLFVQSFLYWIKSMKSKVFVLFTQNFLSYPHFVHKNCINCKWNWSWKYNCPYMDMNHITWIMLEWNFQSKQIDLCMNKIVFMVAKFCTHLISTIWKWWQTKLWLWIRFVAQCVFGHMDALNYMDELWHDGYNWTSKMVLTIDLKGHMKLMVEIIHIVDENICSQFFLHGISYTWMKIIQKIKMIILIKLASWMM